MWDDNPLKSSSFCTILPGVEKSQLRDMEWTLLQLIDYNTSIKPSLYAKYYFDLRQLFFEIVGIVIVVIFIIIVVIVVKHFLIGNY